MRGLRDAKLACFGMVLYCIIKSDLITAAAPEAASV